MHDFKVFVILKSSQEKFAKIIRSIFKSAVRLRAALCVCF